MKVDKWFLVVSSVFIFLNFNLNAEPIKICDDVKEPTSLNPLAVFDDKTHNLLQQIFDGLVQFDSEGGLQPALATSWERIDPLTMRFHLRKGVRFHNKEPFDAEAVRFTLERHIDPNTHFPGFGFISTISSVKIVDPLTVDIITHFPDSLLLRRLAGFVFIVPPLATLKSDFGQNPIGTGPYKFVNQKKGAMISLARNNEYWDFHSDSPNQVDFYFIPMDKQLDLLLSGKLDVITELPGTFTLKVASNKRTKVVKKNTFYTISATFNTSRGPLQDLRVRKAINFSINKADLIRYDVLGNGNIIPSLSMPGEIGHNPNIEPYNYDTEKASALLKETGIKLPITLKTLTKVHGDRTAGVLRENLQRVGINLDIYGVTTDAEAMKKLSEKDVDVGITGFPDIMGHIFFAQSILFYSKSPFSLHKDLEYDKKLEEMVAELDPEKHLKLARELDKYVYDQALGIFTYQRIRTYGVSKKISFVPSVTGRLYCNRIKIISN